MHHTVKSQFIFFIANKSQKECYTLKNVDFVYFKILRGRCSLFAVRHNQTYNTISDMKAEFMINVLVNFAPNSADFINAL